MDMGKVPTGSMKRMTEGPVLSQILEFMLPLLLGNLFQQLYNIVDAMIVGRLLGAGALAAVGSTTSVQFLVLGFCIGSCAGFGIPITQKFGSRDEEGMRRYIFHSALATMLMAVCITLLAVCFCDRIITLMQTPDDIRSDAYLYLLVIFWGIPCTLLYNLVSSIMRALGNSKIPFVFLAISTVLNIFLDLFCIAVLGWGCFGAAFATVASQAVSGIGCLLYLLLYMKAAIPRGAERTFRPKIIARLLYMGLPMGFQYSITAIGSMVMQAADNSLGSVYVSGFTAGTKIKQLMLTPYDALGTAMAGFVGQNVGAGDMKRVKRGIRQTLVTALCYSGFVALVLICFGRSLAGLFVSRSESMVIDAAYRYMAALGAFYWLLAFLIVFRFAVQALGYSLLTVFSGALEMGARSVVSLVFVPLYGYTAICFTDQAAWLAATLYLSFLLWRVLGKKPASD